MRRLLPTVLAAVLAALLAPAAAPAGMSQESIFEDEHLVIDLRQLDALDEMAALGADTVRFNVLWNRLVPAATSAKVPPGFDADDPATYAIGAFDPYDDAVRRANALGLNVLFTPTSPIPRWASQCKGSAEAVATCKPKVGLYRGLVEVLGTRYSGSYADENQGGGVLPRVDRWSFWNEPNIKPWLTPQIKNGRLFAAQRYRQLALAGIRALKDSGHGSDVMLLGETAPLGRSGSKRATPPRDFIAALLCIDTRGKKLRGAAAKRLGCRKPREFDVTGYAHHPYAGGGSQAPTDPAGRGEIRLSNIRTLFKLLDAAGRAGRVPRKLPVWSTEFGFQTKPPDPFLGVSLAKQAEYINQSDYLLSKFSRVKAVAQYKLVDDQDQAAFQSGLKRFGTRKKKPAYRAYRLPIWVGRKGRSLKIYGQVRPAAQGASEQVEVQRRRGKGPWSTVKTVTVDSRTGQFVTKVRRRSGVWRLRWTPAGGGDTLKSRVARVGRA